MCNFFFLYCRLLLFQSGELGVTSVLSSSCFAFNLSHVWSTLLQKTPAVFGIPTRSFDLHGVLIMAKPWSHSLENK